MRLMLTLSLCLLMLSAAAAAAGPEAAGDGDKAPAFRDSGDVVTLSTGRTELAVPAGAPIRLTVTLDIDPRWHLYAHEDSTFYGIDLELPEEHPLQEVRIDYPAGESAEFFGQQVLVLNGRHEIAFAATVPSEMVAGEYEITLTLAVQACDHTRCLAPAFLPVTLKVHIVDNC